MRKIITLNVLYVKDIDICSAFTSKHKSDREKQIILLIIPNRGGWHYLAMKKLSALLRGITLNHDGDFYCSNCLHSRQNL